MGCVLNEWLLLQSEDSLPDLMFLVSTWFLVGQNLRFLTGSSLLGKVRMILKMSVSN